MVRSLNSDANLGGETRKKGNSIIIVNLTGKKHCYHTELSDDNSIIING